MLDAPKEWVDQVKEILVNYVPGIEVRVFGSRITEHAKKYSDLDLVLMTKEPIEAKEMALLNNAFEESDLPIKVDIVDWSAITDSFRALIKTDFIVLD